MQAAHLHAGHLAARWHPSRHVGEWSYVLLSEKFGRHPRRARRWIRSGERESCGDAFADYITCRELLTRRRDVENSERSIFERIQTERGKVAGIDDLEWCVRSAWRN